jgi:hypothetical protein
VREVEGLGLEYLNRGFGSVCWIWRIFSIIASISVVARPFLSGYFLQKFRFLRAEFLKQEPKNCSK